MKKLNITVQSDYEFPLAEATRKQCLYETIISNNQEDTCELWVITNNSNFITDNVNVNVRGINKRDLIKEYQNINKFDLVNFIGNIGFYSMLVSVMYKGPKELTITDGGVFSSTKKDFSSDYYLRCSISFMKNLIFILNTKKSYCSKKIKTTFIR